MVGEGDVLTGDLPEWLTALHDDITRLARDDVVADWTAVVPVAVSQDLDFEKARHLILADIVGLHIGRHTDYPNAEDILQRTRDFHLRAADAAADEETRSTLWLEAQKVALVVRDAEMEHPDCFVYSAVDSAIGSLSRTAEMSVCSAAGSAIFSLFWTAYHQSDEQIEDPRPTEWRLIADIVLAHLGAKDERVSS